MLQVNHLSCKRHDRWLWRDLQFEAPPGQLLQITGANGSGKTSLLRILAGLASPDSGEILWQGKPVSPHQFDYQQQVYYLGHRLGVKNELTVRENCRFNTENCTETALFSAIEQIGLAEYADHFGHQLSQGQKQRVALAGLFLSQAPLWILDEPFANLDAHIIETLQAFFTQKLQKGATILVSTHRPLPSSQLLRL